MKCIKRLIGIWAISLSTIVLVFSACNTGKLDEDSSVKLAIDESGVIQSESTLFATAVDGSVSADAIAAHVASVFTPSGCATATASGPLVTLVFSNCSGPRGLVAVTGELDLTVTDNGDGTVTIRASAIGLQIGQSKLDISSSAVLSGSGASQSLSVNTAGKGKGQFGKELFRTGDYTATWDANCMSVDGSWINTDASGGHQTDGSIHRCEDQCPAGTLSYVDHPGRTLTITYDGTNAASWTTLGEIGGTFNFTCGL